MRILWPALSILLLSSLAIGQEKPKTANCTALPTPSAACISFNELVLKHDKDVLGYIGPNNHTFVCFRPGEDVFIVLSYRQPGDLAYRMGSAGALQADGGVGYVRFREGLFDDFHLATGYWQKINAIDPPTFSAKGDDDWFGASISNSEIGFDYTYENTSGNKVIYSFEIRTSTLRFHESFTGDKPAVPKTAKAPAQPASQVSTANSGYCAEFKPAE